MPLFDTVREALSGRKLAADLVAGVGGVTGANELLAATSGGLADMPAPPGLPDWCWPALAAFLTAAGRLGLVLVEHYIRNRRKDGGK